MVNVRFKKCNNSAYSVYFDVSKKNQKRNYIFLNIIVSKDYFPLFACHLDKRKNMKVAACDSEKINFVRVRLLEAQLRFAKGEEIEPKKAIQESTDFLLALDEIAKEKKHSTYDAAFRQYKAFSEKKTDAPTDASMKKFEAYLENTRLSKKSINVYINRLITAINDLHGRGLITTKLSLYKAPSVPQKEPSFLEMSEIQAFYRIVVDSDNDSEKAVGYSYLLSCFTSLRFGDISQLKWENVDFQKNHICFTAEKTKRKKGEKTYPLLTEARTLLNEVKASGLSEGETILPIIANATANKYIQIIADKADIKKSITFHSSRHSFAVMMIESTGNLYATSKFMGHSNTKMTEIYAHLTDKNMKNMAENTPILNRDK